MRFNGERRWVLMLEATKHRELGAELEAARTAMARAEKEGAALVYGIARAPADDTFRALGWTSLGRIPLLRRPLRLLGAPLLLPFHKRQAGVREITTRDPRITRLWDRFSIDIPVAIERNANYLNPRIWDAPDDPPRYRVFVFEDGDRYVIRALCIFRLERDGDRVEGHVTELLHDRSVAGMRAASHLLGIALREMSDAGAVAATAWSFVHSGSFPIFATQAFLPVRQGNVALEVGVRALDPALEWIVSQRHHWYLSELDSKSG